jgi:EpsI family protein
MYVNPRAIGAAALVVAAACLAHVMIPHQAPDKFNLQAAIPQQFGEWTQVPGIRLVEPAERDALANQLYSQEFGRGYVDREGHLVMLMIAYGPNQGGRLQMHHPEICYVADGFRVSSVRDGVLPYDDRAPLLRLKRLSARRGQRFEPITYWMRVGDDLATGVFDRQFIRLKYALRGIVADGTLVRVSTVGMSEDMAYEVQNRFIRDLLAAVASEDLKYLIGRQPRAIETSARAEQRLVSAIPTQHLERRPTQDAQVEPNATVVNVPEVKLDP